MEKISSAKKHGKKIDGHAPGLCGEDLKKYADSGISTDHECYKLEEAKEKIGLGMKIQLREGSAAKNFDTLMPLIKDFPEDCMFCSDDKHPDDLIEGSINRLVKKAVAQGYDLMDVLRCACVNPVKHYDIDIGLLNKGDSADFIIVNNLKDFEIHEVYIKGEKVFDGKVVNIKSEKPKIINNFNIDKISIDDIKIKYNEDYEKINIISVIDGQLFTEKEIIKPLIEDNCIVSDIENDILKICVVNRYQKTKPAIGFIKNFGLKKGAIASSVAHDSHNIIAVGTNDNDLLNAINLIIENKGGLCVVDKDHKEILPLPIAGLMSDKCAEEVAERYKDIDKSAKILGTKLKSPFMTLSFMALLVIPKIKISDKGLFDGENFCFLEL